MQYIDKELQSLVISAKTLQSLLVGGWVLDNFKLSYQVGSVILKLIINLGEYTTLAITEEGRQVEKEITFDSFESAVTKTKQLVHKYKQLT